MEVDDKDMDFTDNDVSLDLLRDEENKMKDLFDEEADRKKMLLWMIVAVITISLSGISFVVGVKMGRNLERKQGSIREESLNSTSRLIKPVPHPEIAVVEEVLPEKKDTGKISKPKHTQIDIPKIEGETREFMILQNAGGKTKKRERKPAKTTTEVKKKESVKSEEPAKIFSEPSSRKMFTIQIAATENKKQAETLKNSMKKNGYDAYISKVEVRGKTFYRVRVGSYTTEEIAIRAAEELKRKEKLKNDVWITRK